MIFFQTLHSLLVRVKGTFLHCCKAWIGIFSDSSPAFLCFIVISEGIADIVPEFIQQVKFSAMALSTGSSLLR